MKERVIIIGASTTGKTTLLQYFMQHTKLPVSESDDELIRRNGGSYPVDSEYKMNQLAPNMVRDVLAQDKIIFFTNTHYCKSDDLAKAHERGFIIILLTLDREKMTVRSKYRQLHEGCEDHTIYFDDMLNYVTKIQEKGLVDKVIDTDRPVQEIAKEIVDTIQN